MLNVLTHHQRKKDKTNKQSIFQEDRDSLFKGLRGQIIEFEQIF